MTTPHKKVSAHTAPIPQSTAIAIFEGSGAGFPSSRSSIQSSPPAGGRGNPLSASYSYGMISTPSNHSRISVYWRCPASSAAGSIPTDNSTAKMRSIEKLTPYRRRLGIPLVRLFISRYAPVAPKYS